ncbi:MAG: hypothetical protein QM820_43995 [Minicystis sp.]
MNAPLFQDTSLGRRWIRFAALAVFSAGVAIVAVPGCSLIESQQDCESSCDMLNQCGVLQTNSCGSYCTGLVAGSTIAGCGDEFDAQNECGKSITTCDAQSAAKCAPQVKAFAECMDAYCKKTPGAQGCP